MKKTLKINVEAIGEYIVEFCGKLDHINKPTYKDTVDITYVGFDWGQGVMLFSIEHADIVEDIEILEEEK